MATQLRVDVISDVVCPWCYLGKRRLEDALMQLASARPDVEPVLRWFPFFLNPDTPPGGEPYRPFLERKFGGVAAVDSMHARLAEVGAQSGVVFNFDAMKVRPNTLAAHRLIHRAQQLELSTGVLVDELFRAHFVDGLNIGDPDTLDAIAAAIGMHDTHDWLAGDEAIDAVRGLDEKVRSLGVSGVPFFILNGSIAISGAQPVAVLLEALERSLAAEPGS